MKSIDTGLVARIISVVCVILAIACFFGGIVLGVWMFVDAIVDTINEIKSDDATTFGTVLSILAQYFFWWVPVWIGFGLSAIFTRSA